MSKISSTAALPASVVFATSAVNCNVSVFCCFLSPLSGVISLSSFGIVPEESELAPIVTGPSCFPFFFFFLFAFQLRIYLWMLELLERSQKAHFSFWVNIVFFPLSSEFQFTVGVWSVLWGTHGTAKCSMRTSTHCTRRLTSSAVHSHAWAYKKLCNFLLSFLSKCQIGRS